MDEVPTPFSDLAVASCQCLLRLLGAFALPPNLDLSVFVNNLKTTSSRLIRKEFAAKINRVYRKPVFWSRSYCIISCGGAPLSVIKQYVEQQGTPE